MGARRTCPAWVGLVGVAGALALAAGCAASAAMRAAERGDLPALRAAVAAREALGALSDDEAASLARAVAGHDLAAAPPAEALGLVGDALPCARELDAALEARMQARDAAGAAAALARLDAGGGDADDARAHAGDPDPAWRAVGARALVRQRDRPARLRALVDGDPRVRREAARAARDAADPADLGPLSEAARLDPEPIVRTEAVRALAALPPTPGGEAARALRDLWTGGDAGLREDIALAWSSPTIWDAGGRGALRVLAAAGRGPGAIDGAAAVLRHRSSGAELDALAVGLLARAIADGPRSARLQALALAPLDRPDLLDAARAAAQGDDLDVRVGALARLAGLGGGDAPAAIGALEVLAQPGSPVAARARLAAAAAGDRRVQAWVERDLAAPSPADRLSAAAALAAMGVPARAAPLLADGDASVRARAACAIILASRAAR